MDIIQWLEDTAAATRPKLPKPIAHLSEPLDVPGALRNPVRNTFRKPLGARGRSGADSSILVPEDTPPEVPQVKTPKAANVEYRADSTPSDSGRSPAAGSASVPSTIKSAGPYCRKQRRRTRADKYDLKPERPRHVETTFKGRKKKSVRKDKNRRARDKLVAPVVRNFNAPNVLRDRLTVGTLPHNTRCPRLLEQLQPAPNLGLFKKGRASSPFKGRGPPDLAFSEMNFLQKRKGLHDAAIPAESGKTKRTKDRARQAEEEISAYFAPTRPPLEERDVNVVPERHHHSLRGKARARGKDLQLDVSKNGLAQIPIEPIEGQVAAARPRSSTQTSPTYFSWSTSPDPAFDTDTRLNRLEVSLQRSGSDQHAGQWQHDAQRSSRGAHRKSYLQDESEAGHVNHEKRSDNVIKSPNEKCAVTTEQCLEKATERLETQEKKEAERLAASANSILPRSTTQTESLPLPSSPPRLVLHNGTADACEASPQQELARSELSRVNAAKNTSPRSSSPLGELLKDCDTIFVEHLSAGNPPSVAEEHRKDQNLGIASSDDQSAYGNQFDNTGTMLEDVRRSWRITGRDTEFVDSVRQSQLGEDMAIDGQGHATRYDEGVEVYMDDEEAYDDGSNHTDTQDDTCYMLDVENEATSSIGYVQACSTSEGEDGPLNGFWRPNILY